MTEGTEWTQAAREMVDRLPPMPANVARALERVPRHRFVPDEFVSEAYHDEPLPLSPDSTISAPHMVALQLEYANLRPGLKVLEVGTGFGYLAALLAELVTPGGHVYTVEIDPSLAREAIARLAATEYADRVTVVVGDGRKGFARHAPFDRIVISCATHAIERDWVIQLAPHGILEAPVGDRWEQHLIRYRAEGTHGRFEKGPACRFVPLRSRSHGIYRSAN